jgi:cytochrome c-type biogenesis protein CcmH/NrfG
MGPLSRLVPLGVFAVLLFPSPLLAQVSSTHPFNNAQIQVQVRNPDGTAGPRGVQIMLEWEQGGMVDESQTDSSGKCRFVPPAPAVYIVRAKMPGYQETSERVDLQSIQTGFANLVLKPIPVQAPPEPPNDGLGPAVSASDLSVPDVARKEFEKGQKSLQNHDLDSGVSHLKKAIQLHDAFPEAYTMLGTAYLEKSDFKDAQVVFEKAIQLDPKSGGAYLGLGAAFNQTKNYQEADKALTRGVELSPDDPRGHYELAKTYWALGRWQDAEPHAAKAAQLQPDLAPVYVLLGNIMLRKREPQGALQNYKEYLRRAPDGPMAGSAREMVKKLEQTLAVPR